jgi:hypothetical protein
VSTAKRERERRERARRSRAGSGSVAAFAWLPGALLLFAASRAFRPTALQLLLLLHAAWRPGKGAGRGSTFVSYAQAQAAMCCGRTAVKKGFDALSLAGLIELAERGTRPNGPHGAAKRATTWFIPSREEGRRLPPICLPPGVARPGGAVRWHCERIRADVRALSPAALKVLAFCIGRLHRDRNGAVAMPAPFALPQAATGVLLGLSAAAVNSAVRQLVATGRLLLAQKGAGSRAATYELARSYVKHQHLTRAELAHELNRASGNADLGPREERAEAQHVPSANAGPRHSRTGPEGAA